MAKMTREFVIDLSRSVAASGVTPAIDVSQDDGYSFETIFTDLAGTASGTVTLQVSVGGVQFADYSGSGQNFASGTSILIVEIESKRHKFARLKFDGTTAGTGTAATTFYGETFTE
jgi:hypothetical protein